MRIYVHPHQVRAELGGGRKEFSMAEADAFKDFEDTENFLSRLVYDMSLTISRASLTVRYEIENGLRAV